MDFSTNYIMSSLLISCIGGAFFLYGKKAQRLYPLLGGIVLCIYPYFITNLYAMWATAAAIMALLYFLREQ